MLQDLFPCIGFPLSLQYMRNEFNEYVSIINIHTMDVASVVSRET